MEEGKGAAQKGFETRGCRYFMWCMMTKLKHVQQSCKGDAMATMKKARVLHRKVLKPEDAGILCGV